MIRTVLLLVVVAVVAMLLYAATRPDTFAVQRQISIRASAQHVYPLINDLHQFNVWNPYVAKDPQIKLSYSGPSNGPGAAYDFQGNKNVGKGRIEILSVSEPDKVSMKLDMIEPFEGHNLVDFTLAPNRADPALLDVTWAMHGPSAFMGKVMGLFFNMDEMIGRDFEAGLARLKAQAEQPPSKKDAS